ncbi:MAG: hypothetical protein ACI4R9_02805 [Kiritimatiellia bacterium]
MRLQKLVPIRIRNILNAVMGRDKRIAARDFLWDFSRFWHYSGRANPHSRDALLAKIIMTYHVVEKGLTMPERRLGFGKDAVVRLSSLIEKFVSLYGSGNPQVLHAVGVLKEYRELHRAHLDSAEFLKTIDGLIAHYPMIPASCQPHITRDEFFARNNRPFPEFANSRHMVRNYAQTELPMGLVKAAVEIALTTPSACNRQYTRVHCLTGKGTCQKLLMLQKGNRGFGQFADKVLVVTVDLEGIDSTGERNDVFTNGGMFLMNLCYALHYCKIAHCVLNWSRSKEDDEAARGLLGRQVKRSETIIALLSCGLAPDEFDVAFSPRKCLADILVIHGNDADEL